MSRWRTANSSTRWRFLSDTRRELFSSPGGDACIPSSILSHLLDKQLRISPTYSLPLLVLDLPERQLPFRLGRKLPGRFRRINQIVSLCFKTRRKLSLIASSFPLSLFALLLNPLRGKGTHCLYGSNDMITEALFTQPLSYKYLQSENFPRSWMSNTHHFPERCYMKYEACILTLFFSCLLHGAPGKKRIEGDVISPPWARNESTSSDKLLPNECWREIRKHLPARSVVSLSHVDSFLYDKVCPDKNRILINVLVERYYGGHDTHKQAVFRNRMHTTFPPFQTINFTKWQQRHLSAHDKHWTEKDILRQAALCRYLSNRSKTIRPASFPQRYVVCIKHVAVLPDKQQVIVAHHKTLEVWDLSLPDSQQCITTLSGHTDWINSLAILSDSMVISGSSDTTLKVWDLSLPDGQQCVATLKGHTAQISSLALLPNGCVISGSTDRTLKVWDLSLPDSQQCITTLSGHTDWINSLAILSDSMVISGSSDTTLKVWDLSLPDGQQCVATLKGHTEKISSLALLPSGWVISGSADRTLKVWDLSLPDGQQCVTTLPGQTSKWSNGPAILPDGLVVSGSDDKTLKIWDLSLPDGQQCVATLPGHSSSHLPYYIAILPDGRIVSGSYNKKLKVWDLSKADGQRCVTTLSDQSCLVTTHVILSGGRMITCDTHSSLKLWDFYRSIAPDESLLGKRLGYRPGLRNLPHRQTLNGRALSRNPHPPTT